MRKELEEAQVDREVLDEIDFLLLWRNRMAHRFLRQRLFRFGNNELVATADLVLELFEIGNAFTESITRVQAAEARIMSTWTHQQDRLPVLVMDAIAIVLNGWTQTRSPRFQKS